MTEKIKLQFRKKDVYGRILFYPENEVSKTITAVTGKKTLSENELKILDATFNVEIFLDYQFNELNKGN